MKPKGLLLGFALITLTVGGCKMGSEGKKPVKTAPPTASAAPTLPEGEAVDKDLLKQVTQLLVEDRKTAATIHEGALRDYDQCILRNVNQCFDQALQNKVMSSTNPDDCDGYREPYRRKSCRIEIVQRVAQEEKDPSKCDSIDDADRMSFCRREVFQQMAMEKNDPEICLKIEEQGSREWCLSSVYRTLARKDNDVSLCRKIPLVEERRNCQIDFAKQMARKVVVDLSACDAVDDDVGKEQCRDGIVMSQATSSRDPSTCDRLKDKGPCLDVIYWNMARDSRDPSHCEKIIESNQKQHCVADLKSQEQRNVPPPGSGASPPPPLHDSAPPPPPTSAPVP